MKRICVMYLTRPKKESQCFGRSVNLLNLIVIPCYTFYCTYTPYATNGPIMQQRIKITFQDVP
jgi:hypothetical protein